jgi:hypothetical protein
VRTDGEPERTFGCKTLPVMAAWRTGTESPSLTKLAPVAALATFDTKKY